MKLTDKQKEAVHATKGNVLVHAGSGAGKTSAFTARIVNLIANEGVQPDSILGLTFTNDAAENMRERLGKMIGKKKAKEVNLSTFHSFAYRLLKSKYANEYNNKTIMKGWWKIQTLYDIVGKPKNGNNVGLSLSCKAGDLGSFISFQKANMIREGMPVIWKDDFDEYGLSEDMQKAFDTYCELTRNARLIDFDDMLVDLYYKLKEDESLLEHVKNKFEYVMVDEFQDTNTVNMAILKMITDNNLFVVGDFRQGIYGFINANIDNILSFTETFEDVRLIELNDNFRSTDTIVDFANTIIEKSPVEKYKKFDKQLAARGVAGENVRVNVYADEYTEANMIADRIEEKLPDGMEYNDFAILTRTNAQIGFYESVFADFGIPLDISNSRSFFDRREISDLLSYAEHTLQPEDDMSMRKIMNSPSRYISKATVNQLNEYSYKNNMSFEMACMQMDCGRSNVNVKKLVSLFDSLRDDIDGMNASKFLRLVYSKTGYYNHIEKTTSTASDLAIKEESINRLFDIAKKFSSVKAFIGHVSVIKSNNSKNTDGVKLMTVHASKGLEFPYVFLPSITEDNFPHDMNPDVEEERRLFYVASSRAKDYMDISLPVFASSGSETIAVSPFLVDVVGQELLDARKKVIQGSPSNRIEFSKTAVNS